MRIILFLLSCLVAVSLQCGSQQPKPQPIRTPNNQLLLTTTPPLTETKTFSPDKVAKNTDDDEDKAPINVIVIATSVGIGILIGILVFVIVKRRRRGPRPIVKKTFHGMIIPNSTMHSAPIIPKSHVIFIPSIPYLVF